MEPTLIGKFTNQLLSSHTLAFQSLVVHIEKTEWSYVRDAHSKPIWQRTVGCVFVITDKVIHVLSQIATTVEAAYKTVYLAYLRTSYIRVWDEYNNTEVSRLMSEMAYRCPLSALVCTVYVVALPITTVYGLAYVLYDPTRYAENHIEH